MSVNWQHTRLNKCKQGQTGTYWGHMRSNECEQALPHKYKPTLSTALLLLLLPLTLQSSAIQSQHHLCPPPHQTPTGFKIVLHNSSLRLLIVHLPSQPNGSSQLHPLSTHSFHSYSIVPLDYLLPHMLDLDLKQLIVYLHCSCFHPTYWTFYILLYWIWNWSWSQTQFATAVDLKDDEN